MNHYVYLLESRVSTMYYIGCRSCSCKIGDDPYMGSSTAMSQEDKDNCNKIILKRFDTREEAITYEIELHNQFDVGNNPEFWNKVKQTSTGFDRTGMKVSEELLNKHYRNKIFSETHRRRLSEAGKGRKLSEEHKRKIGLAHKGKTVKESSKLYGKNNPAYGKPVSKETKSKISKAGTKFPDPYWWVHKDTGEKLYKTCLEMGKLFDPHRQSSSFTKIVKGDKLKSIYRWTLLEEL